ncbi:MAG: hypothetical protein JWN31_809 [Frankiales bacterium]|nr:hypothetical protein [Frankiales bacterium]
MSEFLTRHGAHLIVMGGPAVLLAGMFAALHLDGRVQQRPARSRLTALLALCWIGSATVHLLVIREHFEEAAVLGAFFLVVCVIQYGYAVALALAESRQLLVLGLLANIGMIGLWTYTRTASVPFGLGPREALGAADVTATAFEAVAVVLAAAALRRTRSAGDAGELHAAGALVRRGGGDPAAVVDGAADRAVVA